MKHPFFRTTIFLITTTTLLSFSNARTGDDLGEVKTSAEKGSAAAQYKLGRAYQKGEGVEKDPAEGLKWLEKAAGQGFAEAQHTLGFMHAHGVGLPQNFAEGLKWYRKAAEQNLPAAQLFMGIECLEGAEANRDFGEAIP